MLPEPYDMDDDAFVRDGHYLACTDCGGPADAICQSCTANVCYLCADITGDFCIGCQQADTD